MHIKKIQFSTRVIKISLIIEFWSDGKMEIPRNVVFRLNRKIKMQQKFIALEYSLFFIVSLLKSVVLIQNIIMGDLLTYLFL